MTYCRQQCRSICRCASAAVDPFGRTTLCKSEDSILLWQCSTFLLKEHSNLTGEFADALLHLLTLSAGQLFSVKINIQFCDDKILFSVKRVFQSDQLQTAAGKFLYALLQLLPLLARQFWYFKINIKFCSDNVLFYKSSQNWPTPDCNAGQFAGALPPLLTLLAGQLYFVKIKILFCSDNVLISC